MCNLPNLFKNITPQQPHLIYAEINGVLDTTIGDMLGHRQLVKSPDREIWRKDLGNDLGRLAQGVGSRIK